MGCRSFGLTKEKTQKKKKKKKKTMFNDQNVKEKEEMTTIAGDFATLITSVINPWEID